MFWRTFFALAASLPFFTQTAFAQPSSDYYDGTKNLVGQELKSKLHQIIDDHHVLDYTESGNNDWFDGKKVDVWEALIYTDSACPGDDPPCGVVQLLYLDAARPHTLANRGASTSDLWEREHVWPKSRGFKDQPQDGYTDLHHLRPADRDINAAHSNYGFDVGGETVNDKLADGTEIPTTARLDKDSESFEPTDQAKGQVARMVFYMAVRYEIGDDGGNERMPDLYLKDTNDRVNQPWIGDLCTLLRWNQEYPVQPIEIQRNNRIQEIQGNRNPFIDHPEWATAIWGVCP